jgi:hypothetical protein
MRRTQESNREMEDDQGLPGGRAVRSGGIDQAMRPALLPRRRLAKPLVRGRAATGNLLLHEVPHRIAPLFLFADTVGLFKRRQAILQSGVSHSD